VTLAAVGGGVDQLGAPAPGARPAAGRPALAGRIRDVAFRQAWKGYDTAQVDDFLDDLASTVEDLESRLGESEERLVLALENAARAEQRSARAEGDEAVRRTLVLAQRAADLVVSEARSVADRIAAEARERAAATSADAERRAAELVADAQRRAETITAQAEAMAERRAGQRAAEIQAELSAVVEERARRQAEVDELCSTLESIRSRQRAFLEDQLRLLADPGDAAAPHTDG
jgi:cell division initiation protein